MKKLRDAGARDAVINGAAWRCVQAGAVFGNISDYIEADFWQQAGAQRDALIDRALDAERQTYKRSADRSAWEAMAPYAVALTSVKVGPLGQPLPANSVTDVIEREQFETEAAAADAARELIEAEENERLRLARNAYADTLEIRHRRALFLICNDPAASNSTVAAQVAQRSIKGIKPETVSRIREKMSELADGILTRSPEDLRREEMERQAAVEEAERAVRKAEARLHRKQWALALSVEELAAFKAFAGPLCQKLGLSLDELLGASIAPNRSK